MNILSLTAISFLIVGAAYAETVECDAATRQVLHEQKKQFSALKVSSKRLDSRLKSQASRLKALSPDLSAEVPIAPDLPSLPLALFDDRGMPLVVCTAEGFEDTTPDQVAAALEESEAAFDLAFEAMETRETALIDAEDAEAVAASDPPAAEPEEGDADVAEAEDPEPESDPAPADQEGDEADPETAQEEESAEPPAEIVNRQPMPDPNNEFLFRRVITLPGNSIAAAAGEDGSAERPVFDVLYVFDETTNGGAKWLEVGTSLRDESLGWIREDQTVAWSTMLVMQFSENPRRGKVLFYDTDVDLVDTIRNINIDVEVEDLYNGIEDERQKLTDDPAHTPEWDPRLVAIEPESAVRYKDKPYLLPILDFRRDEFANGTGTTLVKVAAIPAEGRNISERDVSSLGDRTDPSSIAGGKFKAGIVFVMDTTISMRPYIEETKDMVERFYERVDEAGELNNVSFGLYAFRDNTDHDDDVDYVTEVFQPLDPSAPQRSILSNLGRVTEATAPTKGFKEDGFAGIKEALEETDWSDFQLRVVVMITDASSREGDDGRARYSDLSASYLARIAEDKNVVVVPIHLLTDANEEDERRARLQYVDLAQGIDSGSARYTPIDARGNRATRFAAEFDLVIDQVLEQVSAINRGEEMEAPPLDDELLEAVPEGEYSPTGKLAAVIGNEIFRAQLESLGNNSDDTAPAFLAGWASDRDLRNRDQESLDVRVFLTRNQLSEMAKRLDIIIDSYAVGDDDPGAFFNRIQNLAAEFSTDPEGVKADESLAVQEVMPAFLRNLPYKSEMLKLNFDWWANEGQNGKEEYIERLREKKAIYLSLYDSTQNWVDFGAGDPALEAYPIKLADLP